MKLLSLGRYSFPAACLFALAALPAFTGCDNSTGGSTEAQPTPGWDARRPNEDPNYPDAGLWTENPWAARAEADPELDDRIRELETLGYTGSTQPMPGISGVVRYDPDKAYNGYTMVLSSHTSEARLIDMLGNSLHVWSYDPDAPWPRYDSADSPIAGERNDFETRRYFHRGHLYPNGDFLGMIYAFGLLKLDKDSNVLWRTPGPVHHDMEVTPDGTIYALFRLAGMMPDYHPKELVLDEFVAIYSPDGEMIRKVSILSALRNSDFSPSLRSAKRFGEIFHSNTVHVLDGRFADRNPNFKAGNVLTSLRHTNQVCIIDMETEKVVWVLSDLWFAQHDPRFTESGTMTVFDNRGVALYLPGQPDHVGSRVIEIDPVTQEIVWTFTGNNETEFWSRLAGSAKRLPNGNTLINETRRGRYLEVTPDKEVVWEFINPNQTGPEKQYIADLYDVLRYGPDHPFDWLEAGAPSASGPEDPAGVMDEDNAAGTEPS